MCFCFLRFVLFQIIFVMLEKLGKYDNKNEVKGDLKLFQGKIYDIFFEILGDRRMRLKKIVKRLGLGKMYDILLSIGFNVYIFQEFQKIYEENERQVEEIMKQCMYELLGIFSDMGKFQNLGDVFVKRLFFFFWDFVKKCCGLKRNYYFDI